MSSATATCSARVTGSRRGRRRRGRGVSVRRSTARLRSGYAGRSAAPPVVGDLDAECGSALSPPPCRAMDREADTSSTNALARLRRELNVPVTHPRRPQLSSGGAALVDPS